MKNPLVKVPVMITDEMVGKFAIATKPGNWIIADLVNGKYHYPIAPTEYADFTKCQENCNVLNKSKGISQEQAQQIINEAINAK